jgi:dihydrofolate reductase
MRKVILEVAVSLDGMIAGPNGEYDWCLTDQDYGMSAFFKSVDAIFMGRKSYELVQSMKAPNPWKGMTTYVFSNSLKKVRGKDVELIAGDFRKKVELIKKEKAKDIWLFGGGELTASLMNEGLVDELRMAVHPIVLGPGRLLFKGVVRRIKMTLADTKTYSTGLVSLVYNVGNQR